MINDKERDRLEVINKGYLDVMIITYHDLLQKARRQIEIINELLPRQDYKA